MISFGKNGYDEAGIKQSFITFYKILATDDKVEEVERYNAELAGTIALLLIMGPWGY